MDDIKVEYHPDSDKKDETFPFEEFTRRPSFTPVRPETDQPWSSFHTREDFDFAEIALDAALNNQQIEALIKLFHHCIQNKDKDLFTLSGSRELKETWKTARTKLTPVSSYIFLFTQK